MCVWELAAHLGCVCARVYGSWWSTLGVCACVYGSWQCTLGGCVHVYRGAGGLPCVSYLRSLPYYFLREGLSHDLGLLVCRTENPRTLCFHLPSSGIKDMHQYAWLLKVGSGAETHTLLFVRKILY